MSINSDHKRRTDLAALGAEYLASCGLTLSEAGLLRPEESDEEESDDYNEVWSACSTAESVTDTLRPPQTMWDGLREAVQLLGRIRMPASQLEDEVIDEVESDSIASMDSDGSTEFVRPQFVRQRRLGPREIAELLGEPYTSSDEEEEA